MTDLSLTIAPKSDQINADDLIGGPRTITITRVTADPSSAEQPIAVFFEGDGGKPYKPCKSMRRVMVHLWGADGTAYPGRSMTIYRDPEVQFGGMKVGGIRISHMSHISKPETLALTATRANRKPFTVRPLDTAPKLSPADQEEARAAAMAGTDAFKTWWKNNPGKRDAANAILDELKATCAAADKAADCDAFGLPPVDGPTPEQIAAEAAAFEEMDRQNREQFE